MREDMASLIIIDSQGVRNIDLNDYRKETLLIGRNGNECDIAVASAYASGRHLYFIRKFGECFLCDEGSTNGTFLIKGENRVDIRKTGPYKLKEATSICYLGDGGHPGEEAILVFTTQNNGELKSVHLEQGNTLIGRSEDCDIRLLHPMVSRRHAVVSRNADIITIGDMGSLNGVLVNGVAVNKSVQVSRTAVVQIADTVIIIHNGYLLYFRSVSGVSVEVNHIEKKVGKGKKILNDVSLSIGENEFVAIIGGSGAGKTTLMKMIEGRQKPDSGEVILGQTIKLGYYSQEIEEKKEAGIAYMDPSMRVIDYIKNTAEFVRTEDGLISASAMLERFLFPPEEQYSVIGKLSGGEKRRLNLLRVLMEAPNVLILDEPTNDLDIVTLSILEDYLDNYDGIVITVSHDRYFLDRVVRRIFAFEENGVLRQYEGGYTDYVNRKREEEKDREPQIQTEKESTAKPAAKDTRTHAPKLKFSYKEQREYETIETDIAALEERMDEIDEEIAKCATDFVRLNELTEEKTKVNTELEEKLERWEYLEELAAKIEAQKNGKNS